MTDLPSFAVTGNVFEILGNIVASEIVGNAVPTKVTFTSNMPATHYVKWSGKLFRVPTVTATIDTNGQIRRNGDTIRLLANDPGLSVSGLQWKVAIGSMKTFTFNAPTDGGTVDLASVAPVPNLAVEGIPNVPDGGSMISVDEYQFTNGGVPVGDPLLVPSAAWASTIGKPFIDVTDPAYGAVGDGTTNDVVAMQAAMDAASALATSAGQRVKVMIPPGIYRCNDQLILKSNTVTENQGCLKFYGGDAIGQFVTVTAQSNVEFYGGIIDSNRQGNDNTIGVGFERSDTTIGPVCENIFIHDLVVKNAAHGGSHIADINDPADVGRGGGKGVTVQHGNKNVIVSNVIVDNCDLGVSVEGKENDGGYSSSILFDNIVIQNSKYMGLYLTSVYNTPGLYGQTTSVSLNNIELVDCGVGQTTETVPQDIADLFGSITCNAMVAVKATNVRVRSTTGKLTAFRGGMLACNWDVQVITNGELVDVVNSLPYAGYNPANIDSYYNTMTLDVLATDDFSGYFVNSDATYSTRQSEFHIGAEWMNGTSDAVPIPTTQYSVGVPTDTVMKIVDRHSGKRTDTNDLENQGSLSIRQPGDAYDRVTINDDGSVSLGDGTNPTDTRWFRPNANHFATDDRITVVGNPIEVAPSSSAGDAYRAYTGSDAENRLVIDASGKHSWGSGSVAPDTTLERLSAKLLGTNGIIQESDPTDSTKKFKRNLSTVPTGVVREMVMPVSRTAQLSVANTTTETALVSMTLPTGLLVVGSTFRIRVAGTIQVNATSGFLGFYPYLGANFSNQYFQMPSQTGAEGPVPFWQEWDVTVRTTGASGTYAAGGAGGMVLGGAFIVAGSASASTTAVDTTAATPVVKLTAQWATANAANSLIVQTATIEQVV